jgi:hypothetical protein
MTREFADSAHPTPNPDGPHTPGNAHEPAPVPGAKPHDEAVSEEGAYDSFFDDVNKELSQSIERPAPDPALGPESGQGDCARQLRPEDTLERLIRSQSLSPRTSEVFKAVVGISGVPLPPAGVEGPLDLLRSGSLDPEAPPSTRPESPLLAGLVVESPQSEEKPARDDEAAGEARFPWFQVFLLSYASAVTLALTWVLLTGRSLRPSDRPANVSEPAADATPLPAKPIASPIDAKALPPLPDENIVALGATLRIGDLQVRPLSVALARVELAGSIDPSKYRAEESESLVLRLQLTNLSKGQSFAPLELAYIREQSSHLDRCLITSSGTATIGVYPLAVDSEWSIVGQEARVLERGETLETIIASEPGVTDRLAREMTWRIRMRIGRFRTDLVGVRFHEAEVERDSKLVVAKSR